MTTLILIVAFSTGCATTPEIYRFYEGPPKSANEIAILRGGLPVILCKIDGKSGPNTYFRGLAFSPTTLEVYGSRWSDMRFVVELDPGPHTFQFDYLSSEGTIMGTTIYRASTFPTVSLQAERGAIYEVTASRSGTTWKPIISRVK